jgi:arsenate reductase
MKIVFLCVANSARSQMAEGLAREMASPGITLFSAGSNPTSIRPQAITVMNEIGIDISHHTSKNIININLETTDLLITLCEEEVCPVLPSNTKRLHWPIKDPAGYDDEPIETQLERFRIARELIKVQIVTLFKNTLAT